MPIDPADVDATLTTTRAVRRRLDLDREVDNQLLLDCIDIARAGGRISVIGVHSDQELALPLNTTFVKAIDLKFCGTANIIGRWDDALAMVSSGVVHPDEIISHRLPLDEAVRGYELFASREALKVVLTPAG